MHLQLKTIRNDHKNDTNATNTNVENLPTSVTHQLNHSIIPDNEAHPSTTTHPLTTNDTVLTSKEPIRRSQRIHSLRQQSET